MNKVMVGLFLLVALLVGAQPTMAQGQNKSQVTVVERTRPDVKPDNVLSVYEWKKPGGNPRKKAGANGRALNSWKDYQQWFLSQEGEKDMWAVQLPADILFRMQELVKRGKWSQRLMFSDGSRASIRHEIIPKGTVFDFLTFGRDKARAVIEKVVMLFSAWGRVLTVIKPNGEQWTLITFDICANAGRVHSLLTVTPPPTAQLPPSPPVTTPIPPEAPLPAYTPINVGYVEVPKAARHTVSAPGIIGPLLNVLGKWLGRPVTNITWSTGSVYGSSATGGGGGAGGASSVGAVTATTSPITVNNSQQQQSTVTNQSMNINALNNVNGNGSAGAASGTGNQSAPTTQDQDQ